MKAVTLFLLVSYVGFGLAAKASIEGNKFAVLSVNHERTAAQGLDRLKRWDMSRLWLGNGKISQDGAFGQRYWRIKIYFTASVKDKNNPLRYNVKGKTLMKGKVTPFSGSITLTEMNAGRDDYFYEVNDTGSSIDYLVPQEWGEVSGVFVLNEDKADPGAGTFSGCYWAEYALDTIKGVAYRDETIMGDGYSNNVFEGKWKAYKGGQVAKINFFDGKPTTAGELNIGAGDFMVADEYKHNGWETHFTKQEVIWTQVGDGPSDCEERDQWWLR